MRTHEISPLKVVWWIIWYKPAIEWAAGDITFMQMIWKYIIRIWFIFIMPAMVFGIYQYENTPDYVWARPNPTKSLEEQRRNPKLEDICGDGPLGSAIHPDQCK